MLNAITKLLMITTEKIKVYGSYGGDIDELERVGSDFEKKLFDNDDWYLIDSFCGTIRVINKIRITQSYINDTLLALKENCDHDSFEIFTNAIECYKDFQKIADILKQLKTFISRDTDTVWAGVDNADKFLEGLNQDIKRLERCDYNTLEKVHREFLPTSTYQELSISNGWGDIYTKLSNDFEHVYEELTESETAYNSTLPKAGRSWLRKLFGSK